MIQFSKIRPDDPRLEYALLTRWKCCLCEMVGNEMFKHHRDYKAIITLFNKWLESIKNTNDERDQKFYEDSKDYQLYTAESIEENWSEIEDIRILIHNYMRERMNYNPESLDFPENWAIGRIRELTQS